MALVNCPECNKEISDKSKTCINCGYTFKSNMKVNKKVIAFTLIIFCIILIVLLIVYFNYKTYKKPKQDYDTAISLAEHGKYEEAINILNQLGDSYENVVTLKDELKYESKLYICINNLKKILKNPDSLQLYEVKFFTNGKLGDKGYVTILNYGAQNGFGGNTTGYALFASDGELTGTCSSLNIYDIDKDKFSDKLTCAIINTHLESSTKVGCINLNRVKTILKNDAYSTIKVIN